MRITAASLALAMGLSALAFAPVQAELAPAGENVEPVSQFAFGNRFGKGTNGGTDSDFIEMQVPRPGEPGVTDTRMVGVFGSIGNGAFVMDVTDGEPTELSWYGCSLGQGDIQLFQREEARGTATYFTFTDDGYSAERVPGDACSSFGATQADFVTSNKQGTFIVDITDPRAPQTINFVPFPRGSHNMTVSPDTTKLYNSNSELITNAANAGIEIYDITDLRKEVNKGILRLPVRPGLGTDSHDISFSADGTRAYSAALSQTVIIDTGLDAATGQYTRNPSVLSSFVDPMINVEHQAERFTLTDATLGVTRDFLIVEDEFAGAAAGTNCPSGGVHVYDVTGPLELAPVKVGAWFIDDVRATNGLASCTAHVFQVDEEAAVMTIAFYNGGVRVVDLSGLVGLTLGGTGVGMKEIGFHRFDDSNSWSVKAPVVEVAEDGTLSAWLYSNDIDRGLDTYRFEGTRAGIADASSRWYSPQEAIDAFGLADDAALAGYTPFCLLKGGDGSEFVPAHQLAG